MIKEIIKKSLENSFSYQEYRNLVSSLLAKGESTAQNGNEELVHYSELNDRRMKRLDKTIKITDNTTDVLTKVQLQTWLVITEGWCGDAAQNIPVIYKMASVNKNISLRLVLRDKNEELMDNFLTNKGRAIPKLIMLDTNNSVIGTWGPRPSIATKMVLDYKEKHGGLDADFKKDLQVWYNKNKGKNLQEDIIALLN